jgi:hypothetical protein
MNPIIQNQFTADPTVLVKDNVVWLYTGHDEPPDGEDEYVMKNWLCFSSSDLIRWKAHLSPLKATDFKWASGDAFASKVIEREGIFYWYAAVSHRSIPGKAIGVAISEHPEGPFHDLKGEPLISGDMVPPTGNHMVNLDPTVMTGHDGQAYIIWGNKTCFIAKLKNNMTELDGPIETVNLPGFSEGANLHSKDGWYYLSYGYQMPEQVAYAMSRNLAGPWEFKGIINQVPYRCETNRPAIISFKNRNYFFYHNGGLEGGGSHRRSVCVDDLHYHPDGRIKPVEMTTAGPIVLRYFNKNR